MRISKARACSITILKHLTWTCKLPSQTRIWGGASTGKMQRAEHKQRRVNSNVQSTQSELQLYP